MHETAPRERDHLRLELPPVRERPRPLPRPPHLVDLLARENDAAVDDSRHDRRQLLGGHRHHALVEEGKPFAHPAVPDQHVTLSVDREREEIAVAEALPYAHGLLGDGGSRGVVPCSLVLEHGGKEQVPALGALPLRLDEALGPAEPAAGRADLPTRGEVQADPRRAANGGERLSVARDGRDAPARATRRSRRHDRA